MKKISILDIEGKKIKEIETSLFEEPIREDIIFKIIEAEKTKHPYRPKLYAGMNRSASGNVRHKRHSWKSDRGRGMSRFPKKKLWRRGNQFAWVAAIIPSARGGRRAHPPKGIIKEKKINKKEYIKGLLSCLSYISDIKELKKKYKTLKNKEIKKDLPIVVEDKILKLKSKEFFKALEKILGELYKIAIQKKKKRAGKGKMRGRRYKKNAGLLFVISKNEDLKIKGIEIVKTNKLKITHLASGGARLVMFSENAIKELEKKLTK